MQFKDTLKTARKAAQMSRAQLAGRLRCTTQEIGYWETGARVPDDAKQAEILAAIAAPSLTIRGLVAELQADIAARIARFEVDAQSATAPPEGAPLPDGLDVAIAAAAPAVTPRPARTRTK
jgi:transcriptional regulator with XRE-family HTH domain